MVVEHQEPASQQQPAPKQQAAPVPQPEREQPKGDLFGKPAVTPASDKILSRCQKLEDMLGEEKGEGAVLVARGQFGIADGHLSNSPAEKVEAYLAALREGKV